jgi:hypothetical protein
MQKILKENSLPSQVDKNKSLCVALVNKERVISVSGLLAYPKSFSISNQPLFSYVWGPAPEFTKKHKYYVSFINDCSKFTWIYLLKFKFEVF